MYELSDYGDIKPLRSAAKMPDKNPWKVESPDRLNNVSEIYDDPARIVDARGMEMGEAADMYGDIETVEDYGYVTRR